MKKTLLIISSFLLLLMLFSCDFDMSQNQTEIKSIEIAENMNNSEYDIKKFNLSELFLSVFHTNGTKQMVRLNESMLSLEDLDKLKTTGNHSLIINYMDYTCELNITLYKMYNVSFYVDDTLVFQEDVKENSALVNVPSVPKKEGFDGTWDYSDFSNITADLVVHALYFESSENVLQLALAELDSLIPEEVSSSITLPAKIEDVSISYETNSVALDENGNYQKPYIEEIVTLTATLTKDDKSITKNYQIKCLGYKDLTKGIASSYLYRNYGLLTDEFFDTMDIVYCCFIRVDVDGDFIGNDASGSSILNSNKTTKAKIKDFVQSRAQDKGVYIVPSLGGGGSDASNTFKIICQDATLRKQFAENIVKLINENGYDGIDIDWETPGNTYKTYFTLMMEEIYQAVKANNPNHIVTAAIGGGKWQPPYYDLTNSAKYLDYINVMCYGMVSNNGYYQNALYPHTSFNDSVNKVGRTLSSCSISESLKIYQNLGVSGSKLLFGLAFYGIQQIKSNGSWTKGSSIFYDSIKIVLESGEYDYYFDDVAKVPYLLSKDGLTFISYDDERSIIEKCHYVLNNNIAGIMYWENGCDTTGDLVHAINMGFNKAPSYYE